MDLIVFLNERPALKKAILADVVFSGGPGGQIVKCDSLVFQYDPSAVTPYCCHYDVIIEDNPDETWGSIVDCTEEDYEAGKNWDLDMKSQGFA